MRCTQTGGLFATISKFDKERKMAVELRSYVYLDRLQPQFAAFVGANARGYIPIPGMAAILVEISPGVKINDVTDAALKSANVKPGMMVVERHFGVLEFHAQAQEEVKHAGQAVLKTLGLKIEDRVKPKILSSQVIHKVNPYHAQMVNVSRLCSMLLPGQILTSWKFNLLLTSPLRPTRRKKTLPSPLWTAGATVRWVAFTSVASSPMLSGLLVPRNPVYSASQEKKCEQEPVKSGQRNGKWKDKGLRVVSGP